MLADTFSTALVLQVEDNGSGLGLAIVAEVVQQHGASLSMEDTDSKASMPGVRFTVRMQRTPEA